MYLAGMALWTLVFVVIVGSASAQSRPPLPAFEDQLYMIGRAQEEEIKQLRKENEELKKRVDELSKKEDPPKEGK